MHGYEIAGYFSKHGLDLWVKVKTPSVYKALNRLEEQKYIVGKMEKVGSNPPRKVFNITASGREYFSQLLENTFKTGEKGSPLDYWNAMRFVQGNLTENAFIEIIEFREKFLENLKEKMRQKCEMAQEGEGINELPFYGKIMVEAMHKIRKIEIETLAKLKTSAQLPENKKIFIQENK